MVRDLRGLAETSFDLLIIGAGIYGTTAAWDATQRGLSVAIIDRADFGSGTSFNSAKTIHGGVRALQSGQVRELRQFVRERRTFCRIAPHLVEPVPFIIPTYARIPRNRWLMRAYFALNDLLAHDRNDHVDPALRLPSSRLVSRSECLALSPTISPASVTGGIEWHDCQMYNSDRLTLAFLQTATKAGAVAANHVEAVSLRQHSNRVTGVEVRDRIETARFDIRARAVLNCAGPWAPELIRSLAPELSGSLPTELSVGMNLVTSRPLVGTHAVGAPAGGRLLFMSPWRGRVIVGTSYDRFGRQATQLRATRRDVARFLSEVNNAFPGAGLELSDIGLVHRGLLPAVSGSGDHPRLLRKTVVRDHRQDGVAGVVSVLGVRYSTARDSARQAVDAVFRVLGKAPPVCRTDEIPLVGGDIPDFTAFLGDVARAADAVVHETTAKRLARSYGSTYHQLADRLRATPDDGRALGANCAVTLGEIRHAVRDEMAVRLSDALLRRTEAGSGGHPGHDATRAAGCLMATELGWSDERLDQEIAEVDATYRLNDN